MRYLPLEPPFNQRLSAGFTLVEIAIVLVIIGLIIGGIMVGGEMIHSATLRRVVSEKNPYEAAIRTFHLQLGG
jgi:prepilin-type N-terminal cleavage/methylation domain-containing protein